VVLDLKFVKSRKLNFLIEKKETVLLFMVPLIKKIYVTAIKALIIYHPIWKDKVLHQQNITELQFNLNRFLRNFRAKN
jgi:hypothetical protein